MLTEQIPSTAKRTEPLSVKIIFTTKCSMRGSKRIENLVVEKKFYL
jgi:hypothetical protein